MNRGDHIGRKRKRQRSASRLRERSPNGTHFDQPERASVRFGHKNNCKPDATAFRLFIEFSRNHSLIFLAVEHHCGWSIAGVSEMDEPRTLPDLIKHTEKLARQLMDHFQYDVTPKAQRLVDAARPDPATLAESEEFTTKLYREWVACSKRIDQMVSQLD